VRRRARYAAGGGGGGFGGRGGGGLGGLSGQMATRKVKRVLVVLMSPFSTPIRIGLEEKPRPPEARSLRWIPEALEVSGLTHRQ